MTAEHSASQFEPVGLLGTNGHEPPFKGGEHENVEKLLEAVSQLVDGLRDMTTSWSVERTDVIKDIRVIKDKMVDLELMKAKVDDIEEFIKGGEGGHLGQKIAVYDHKIKALESEHHNRQKERSRTFWTVISLVATVFAGVVVEVVKLMVEFQKH
jgi:hypothetical protein